MRTFEVSCSSWAVVFFIISETQSCSCKLLAMGVVFLLIKWRQIWTILDIIHCKQWSEHPGRLGATTLLDYPLDFMILQCWSWKDCWLSQKSVTTGWSTRNKGESRRNSSLWLWAWKRTSEASGCLSSRFALHDWSVYSMFCCQLF